MSQLRAHNRGKGVGWPSPVVFYPILKPFKAAGHAINTSVSWIASAPGKASRATVHAFGVIAQALARAVGNTARTFAHGVAFTAGAFARAVGSIALAYLHLGRSIGLAFTNTAVNSAKFFLTKMGRGLGRALQPVLAGFADLTFRLRRTTVTLSVDPDELRAVAFKGNRVVAWVSVAQGDEPITMDATAAPGEEESDLSPTVPSHTGLESLMAEMPPGRSRLITDFPLYAPLVRHLQLPKVKSRYLRQVILSEVLNTIPFDQEEVDISWRLRRRDGGREAFAVAVLKSNVDAQVRLVKDAGLRPSAAYAKATALAFLAGAPDAIVAHLADGHLTTVLVRDNLPRVVHQQEFPTTDQGAEVQADSLVAAVDQLTGYYQDLGPQVDSDAPPVVLTGQLTGPKGFGQDVAPDIGTPGAPPIATPPST